MVYVLGIIGMLEAILLIVLNKVNQREMEKNQRIECTVTDLMTAYWKMVIDYQIENPMHYVDFVRNVKIMDIRKEENFEKQIELLFNQRKREGK
ncbi:MAG: hypothetical protein KBT48_08810 [Firmicutes bacterium]|nr:hypothetical protein [Bacillota bacterium]